jgi:hypothetical protein
MKRNNELQMMLDGDKPMSVFYRAVPERFDEKSGQPFDEFVKSGKINRITFYIKNRSQDFRIFYTVYTLRGEEWRAEMYKKLKKVGQNIWNEDLQAIEDLLYGYQKQ